MSRRRTWNNLRTRQLQFFTNVELAAMRDRARSRNYAGEGNAFRRDHERHRKGDSARHRAAPRMLRRLHGCSFGCGAVGSHDSTDGSWLGRPARVRLARAGLSETGRPTSHARRRSSDIPGIPDMPTDRQRPGNRTLPTTARRLRPGIRGRATTGGQARMGKREEDRFAG
jgi:hypothetical protein